MNNNPGKNDHICITLSKLAGSGYLLCVMSKKRAMFNILSFKLPQRIIKLINNKREIEK